MRKREIVILGHSGFLGRCLYENFSKDCGFLTQGFSSDQINLLSLDNCKKLRLIINEETTLIMAAGIIITKDVKDDLRIFEDNVNMILNLLHVLSEYRIKHLLYMSSIYVYGRSVEAALTEESRQLPGSFYGAAKSCIEIILKQFSNFSAVPLTILRPGTIYDAREDSYSPIHRFVESIKNKGGRITIFGDGSYMLFPIHRRDLCEVIKSAVLEVKTGDFNAIPDAGVSLLELARLMFALAGREAAISFQLADRMPIKYSFDNSKFKTAFAGFEFTKLEDGIKECLAT